MKLMCPICKHRGKFIIAAEMTVTVPGHDCLAPISPSDVADIAYGDSSACTCASCGYRAPLNVFLDLPAGVLSIAQYDANLRASGQTGLCPVYPLRPPRKDG